MIGIRRPLCLIGVLGGLILSACGAPASRSIEEEARLIDEAAQTLSRYCVKLLPNAQSVNREFQRNSGSRTGKSYIPINSDGVLEGAQLLDASGVGAYLSVEELDVVCAATLFTVNPVRFETGIIRGLEKSDGLVARRIGVTAEGDREFALDGYALAATLTFRPTTNSIGDGAIAAEIRVPTTNDLIGNRRSRDRPNTPRVQPEDPYPDYQQVRVRQPVPGSPPLTEGTPYAAFTAAQINAYCQQDWRSRVRDNGRTEYNPCFERSAFK